MDGPKCCGAAYFLFARQAASQRLAKRLTRKGPRGPKAARRDVQTEQELAVIAAGAACAKTTRRQILQRTLRGRNAAIKNADTARLFRRIGATNSFCGKDDGELDSSIRRVWGKYNMRARRALSGR